MILKYKGNNFENFMYFQFQTHYYHHTLQKQYFKHTSGAAKILENTYLGFEC